MMTTELSGDKMKIIHLIKIMEIDYFTDEHINNLEISRIGKERENYNRLVKITMQSIQERDELLKNSNKLKNATEIWKKVYIKKDQHPVYVAETTGSVRK